MKKKQKPVAAQICDYLADGKEFEAFISFSNRTLELVQRIKRLDRMRADQLIRVWPQEECIVEFQTIVEFGDHNRTQLHFDRNSIDLFCSASELMNYMYGILVTGDFARESDQVVLQYCYILQEVCAYMTPSQYFWMASDVDEQNPSARLRLVD
jgi:hypothetical protein